MTLDRGGAARLAGIEKAMEDRRGKASGVLFSTLSDNMKIIAVPSWESVQSSVSTLARKRPEWFPQGFDAIHAVSNPEFFAAVDGATIYFSNADEQVPGFKPASLLAQAIAKAKKGEALSFNEEYAVETLWHELTHGITRIKALRVPLEKEPLAEGVVQLIARHTYQDLLIRLGSRAEHQKEIIASGLAYPMVTGNLIALLAASGLDSSDVVGRLLSQTDSFELVLTQMLSDGLGIPEKKVRNLLYKAEAVRGEAFRIKIDVQTTNYRRSKDAS